MADLTESTMERPMRSFRLVDSGDNLVPCVALGLNAERCGIAGVVRNS